MMYKYIALLRGINVSGQKKIKMAELKEHLKGNGFGNIITYIQSGNIIFDSGEQNTELIAESIPAKIKEKYGFDVETIVLLPEEINRITINNPFVLRGDCATDKLYYTILKEVPEEERLKILDAYSFPPEEFILAGKVVFFHSPDGYGRAKMNNNFFENILKVSATTRNHKTMLKLYELATN